MRVDKETLTDKAGNDAPRSRPRGGAFRASVIIVSLVLGVAVVAPYFLSEDELNPAPGRLRMIASHDLQTHLAMMEEFDKMLRAGIIYPRWLPDINNGYGNPTMNFYPPGFYYITSLVNLFFGDWILSTFVIAALGLGSSGLALYFLSRQFYGRLASSVAALFYMLLPYHVLDLYWRGAAPEFLGFVLIPLVVYFAFKTGSQGRASHYAGLGLLYGLHLMIHFPVSYLFTYTLAIYALIWAAKERDLRIAVRIGAGMALGLLMAAIYWLPAAVESKYTQEFVSDVFPYEETLLRLSKGQNAFDALINYTFIAQTAALLVAVVILALTRRFRGQAFLWSVLGLFATFMSTVLATHVTRVVPRIQATVPAWRWLAIASLFTALAMAAAVERLYGAERLPPGLLWVYRLVILAAIGANAWLSVQQVIIGSLSNGTLAPFDHFYQSGFTPKGSVVPNLLPDTERAVLRFGSGMVNVIRWDPLYREVEVNTGQPGLLRLKTYQFPGWKARIDGQEAELTSDASGVQLIQVPPGRRRVEVYFENTPSRTLATALTIAALSAICGLAIIGRIRARASAD